MHVRNYLPHLLNGLLVIGILVGGLVAYPSLPDHIPSHSDLSGTPDAFVPKSMTAWFLIAAPGLGLMVLMYFLAGLLVVFPAIANILNGLSSETKNKLRSLSFAAQQELLRPFRGIFYGLALAIGLVTATLQAMTYATAQGGTGLPFILMDIVWLVGIAVYIFLPFRRLEANIHEAHRRTAQPQ